MRRATRRDRVGIVVGARHRTGRLEQREQRGLELVDRVLVERRGPQPRDRFGHAQRVRGSDRRSQVVRAVEHVAGHEQRPRAQPVDAPGGELAVEALLGVLGRLAGRGGGVVQRQHLPEATELEAQVTGPARWPGRCPLHQLLDHRRGQRGRPLAHGPGVGPQLPDHRQSGQHPVVAGRDGHHHRRFVAGAGLIELGEASLELGVQQRAQARRPVARGPRASGIREGPLELASAVDHLGRVRGGPTGYSVPMNRKLLGIYLNDHLGGSIVGVELARRAAHQNEGSEFGAFLADLAKEIEADRGALMAIMDDLGVRKDPVRRVLGWAGEKVGRLKLNGQLRGYSPLSRLEELEGLALGVTGKLALWKALRLVAEDEPRLAAHPLERLLERAEQQQREIEERRLSAARLSFA